MSPSTPGCAFYEEVLVFLLCWALH